MVAVLPFLTTILLATGKSPRKTKKPLGRYEEKRSTGRKRYNRDGAKRKKGSRNDIPTKQVVVDPLPRITKNLEDEPLPYYYTCRHTYENTLIDEIHRFASLNDCEGEVLASTPYPGLVRVEEKEEGCIPDYYDPVYALQAMPKSVVCSAESIKGLAKEILFELFGDGDSDEDENTQTGDSDSKKIRKELLLKAEKGSLIIHALVPGMIKGSTAPPMMRRSIKVGEEISKIMKKTYKAARKNNEETEHISERWLLQIMLQSNEIAVASLVKTKQIGPGKTAYWPNSQFPLGLAKVDIEEKMPSSAYRKLSEGLACMQLQPSQNELACDLGASPGGWTSILRKFGTSVISIDRSELDPVLMRDDKVQFLKGDAFTFEPESVVDWMVSDVIAYPEKTIEMLDFWCSNKLAKNMIVTMKFQGHEPALDELDRCVQIVRQHSYSCRVKHFFNNKNEVTFMVSQKVPVDNEASHGIVSTPMFQPIN